MTDIDVPKPVIDNVRCYQYKGRDISTLTRKELERGYEVLMQAYLHEVDENIMLFNNLTTLAHRPWWKFWRPK